MANRENRTLEKPAIIIAGDVAFDWLEASTTASNASDKGDMAIPNWQTYPSTRLMTRPGGAFMLADWVRAASGMQVKGPEIQDINGLSPNDTIHSYVCLDRFASSTAKKDEKNLVYRVKQFKGYSGPHSGLPIQAIIPNDDPHTALIVLDDAGNGFRDSREAWPMALSSGAEPIVILKMSKPLAQGALWAELRQNHAERTVVVISADDLRSQGVNISRRLSWERTAKDFVWQMASNPTLIGMNNWASLVIRFGVDGAILYTRRDGVVISHLFFDPKTGEDGFSDSHPGQAQGVGNAFVAALATRIAEKGMDGLAEGVRHGLSSARRLWLVGFGPDLSSLGYPGAEIFSPLAGEAPIADVHIPEPSAIEPADPAFWCILDDIRQSALEDMAFECVLHGPERSLSHVPMGQFRNLRTFDRSEIESFRSISNLIREYLNSPKADRPLSVAVFGPPGSGKSFGVTEVAESVAPGRLQTIEFNLSQFSSQSDLIGALHKVRDVGLGGKIPIVFFDEFDSEFGGSLGWLKSFLAPMQDGKFRDGETMHPLGKAIFVFAGGTCATFAEFGRENDTTDASEEAKAEFKKAKGPDFVSRLRGYINIKGPNPLSENDTLYVIRRALNLRFLLESKAPHLLDRHGTIQIDPGVLRAMIKVPRYKHGVRSIQAIIEMSMLAGRSSFEQAALPSSDQLALHVDTEMFSRLVIRDVLLGSARETLAQAFHERYRSDQKTIKPEHDPALAPWGSLAEHLKESNRRLADHIPTKLKAAGYGIAPVVHSTPTLISFSADELEMLAEMEHARWTNERLIEGWSLGTRDPIKKTSPYLVDWEQLEDDIREYDRQTVRQIPTLLAEANFELYRLR